MTGNVIASEVSLFDSKFGFGDTYDHRVEEDGVRVSSSGSPYDDPFAMKDYPDVKKGNQFACVPFVINNDGDILLSLSASAHVIIGGHVTIAFNISEFIEGIFSE